MNTQAFISEAFGFKSILPIDMTMKNAKGITNSVFKIAKKASPFIDITKDNASERCIMCGVLQ